MSATVITLDQITGLSPRNVRGASAPADVADLAASIAAFGLIQPLVVEGNPLSDKSYLVVDGGRRFAALTSLIEAGTLDVDYAVPIVVLHADISAREISLAANVMRRDLHPVEAFEAFAELTRDGLPVERIAADFGCPPRFVRQRLALDRLSPRVRALWRAGEIDAEDAAHFTKAPDHAAQDRFLDDLKSGKRYEYELSSAFKKGGVRADAPQARYVGLDAYQAAGGTIDDNLFEDWSICEDGALLEHLARQKMLAEGAAILERTGFGTCLVYADVPNPWDWGKLPVDVTQADKDDLAAIDAREAEVEETIDDPDEAQRAIEAFAAERTEIHLRAVLRGSTAAQRATAAIFVKLVREGRLSVDYGRTGPVVAKGGAGAATPRAASSSDDREAPTPKPADKPPTKLVVECLDQARQAAFATMIAARPMLAMMLCTAALRTSANRSPLRIAATGRNGTIAEPTTVTLAGALTELLALPDQACLMDAFARAVAQTVAMVTPTYERHGGRADPDELEALVVMLSTYATEDYEPQMAAALDYGAYFRAATRAAALTAIEEAGGNVNETRKLKAPEAAASAAELAADRAWLPKELRIADPVSGRTHYRLALDDPDPPEPSLVEAMADAIAADAPAEPDVTPAESAVAEFLSWACVEGGAIGTEHLYAEFCALASMQAFTVVPSCFVFADAMKGLGFTTDDPITGDQTSFYSGVRFRTGLPQRQAAE